MTDHAEFIRQKMRESWSARHQHYIEAAAPNTAAFARVLVSRVPPRPGERVLDVATGPGVVARAAATEVGRSGYVLATDLVPEWEAYIAEECTRHGIANLEFKVMGAEALEVPDQSFDVALCQFGLMFVPDPVQALREMRRALREGGRLGVVVWSTGERVHCFAVQQLLGQLAPPPPPEERLPNPLSLGEPGLIERHVAEAGFRDIQAAKEILHYTVEDPETQWRHASQNAPAHITAWLAALADEARERLHDDVIALLERYRRGDRILMPSEAILVTARC